jgi:mRNA interferase MazF
MDERRLKSMADANAMEIYVARVPYDDGSGAKFRPAIVVKVGASKIQVFKITTKYAHKSPRIKNLYFKIQDLTAAGLNQPSYIDIHKIYQLPTRMVTKYPPIGKLSSIDVLNLSRFIAERKDLI